MCMKEIESPYKPFRELVGHFRSIKISIKNGIVRVTVPNSDSLGFERKDSITGILDEIRAFGEITRVKIDEHRAILVGTTFAAAPHTPFTVPYGAMQTALHTHSQKENSPIHVNEHPAGQPKTISPTNFVHWLILEEQNSSGIPTYTPIDLFDLAGAFDEYEGTDSCRAKEMLIQPQERNLTPLKLDVEKKTTIYQSVLDRLRLSNSVLLDLYNNTILPQLNELLQIDPILNKRGIHLQLSEKSYNDAAGYFAAGFWRGNNERRLSQKNLDGLGGGPQSLLTAHFHSNIHFDLEHVLTVLARNQCNDTLRHVISILFGSESEFLKHGQLEIIDDLHQARNGQETDRGEAVKEFYKNVDIESLVKQTDIYGTEFYHIFEKWMLERLNSCEHPITNIDSFKHHTQDSIIMRHAEGWELTIQENMPDFMIHFEGILKELNHVWIETQDALFRSLYDEKGSGFYQPTSTGEKRVKNDKHFRQIQQKYNLPDAYVVAAMRLKPTRKQLIMWQNLIGEQNTTITQDIALMEKRAQQLATRYHTISQKIIDGHGSSTDLTKLIALRYQLERHNGYMNLEGNWYPENVDTARNKLIYLGKYNIPNLPSFGVSIITSDTDSVRVLIGPLLSEKGLGEQILGELIVRQQAKQS